MPQIRAYKQRQQMRLGNSTGATRPLPARAVADVAAMQPTIGGSMCSPGILPDQLCADSCFAFYNPISQPELEHYVNSWLENLVAASEYVVANPRPAAPKPVQPTRRRRRRKKKRGKGEEENEFRWVNICPFKMSRLRSSGRSGTEALGCQLYIAHTRFRLKNA